MEGELHKRRLQTEGAVGGGAKGPAPQIVRAGAVRLSLQEGRGQAPRGDPVPDQRGKELCPWASGTGQRLWGAPPLAMLVAGMGRTVRRRALRGTD